VPIPEPQSLQWPADRAVLLVHGVGSAKPGDYDALVAQVTNMLAAQPKQYAVYMFYYDYINEWFSQKTQASLAVSQLVSAIRARAGSPTLGNTVASFVGDVIWPILSLDARDALRTALFRQLRQIWLDGAASGVNAPSRKVSIICHSLGCFHVFEALHAAARDPREQLGPVQGVQFENVIFMASPVQMISTVARAIGPAVPRPGDLACLNTTPLAMPQSDDGFGSLLPSVKRTVSITGNLDPVGGHIFRAKLPWAYMNVPGQLSFIDQQEPLTTEGDLQAMLQQALQEHAPPKITPQNPHDWTAYVTRHAEDLKQWLA
jgi:hypothetical protein